MVLKSKLIISRLRVKRGFVHRIKILRAKYKLKRSYGSHKFKRKTGRFGVISKSKIKRKIFRFRKVAFKKRRVYKNIRQKFFELRRVVTTFKLIKRLIWTSSQINSKNFFKQKNFSTLSPKRYNFVIQARFWHNNIRVLFNPIFLFSQCSFSSGLIPEFSKKKKLKRSYTAGLELWLYAYQVLCTSNVRTFRIISAGGFGGRKGFFAGLKKLKTIGKSQKNKKSKPILMQVRDKTTYSYNGTKRAKRRRL
jgi:hypothetical protein